MVKHIFLNNTIYRIEEKEVQKNSDWVEKEKKDLEKLEKELAEMEVLRNKYLTGSYYVYGICESRLNFNVHNKNIC
jgi:hypothetical protein